MPIKLPKGFARRKSSGTVLEEVENPPQQSSFKVFERPDGGSRSFDGANALKRISQGRPLSSPGNLVEDDDDLFADVRRNPPNNRGSGGTNNSASTGGLYDSSASSARFSSSSTLPSSTDVPMHGENNFSLKRALHEIPVPPIPESRTPLSLRERAGRTLSFGMKSPKSSPITSSRPDTGAFESPTIKSVTRERAMTASTASTATPPKLLDSDLSFNSGSEGFSNLFESFDKRRTPPLESHGFMAQNTSSPIYGSSPPPPVPPKSDFYNRPSLVPSPINVDRTRPIESSPYSWDSRDSREGLMSSPSPPVAFSPAEVPSIPRKSITVSKIMPIPEPVHPTPQSRPGLGPGLRRSSGYGGRRRSTPIEDEEARLVQNSAPSNRAIFLPPSSFGRNSSPQADSRKQSTAMFDSDDGDIAGTAVWRDDPSERTPRPKKILPYRDAESPTRLDTSLAANALLASQYEEKELAPSKPNNKIMTPAQFERYRRQQELTWTKSDASKSDASGEGSDNYDDEDETERNKQAAKQRKKQEAHLAVYRQQMMKVTGEQPTDIPNLGQPRTSTDRASMSTPNLPSRLSTLNFGNENGGRTSDDEDEDVPLGILAAHGFPNKNRPPTRLSTAGSSGTFRGPSNHGSPASVMGDSTAQGPRSILPVFARHLPQDPYYGASLVNTSNREGLAMNGGTPQGQPGPPPGMAPGGLVGVIAGEERARAMRRGSPNAGLGYEPPHGQMHPGMQRSQTVGNMSTVGPMGMPGMPGMPLTPGDQAQIQMSQQMTQMMNMQMQWMQQMMQMQGMQPGQMPPQMPQGPPGMNNFLAPPGQMQRPMSMGSNGPGIPSPQQDQRTMSMLDPGQSQWRRGSTFAPSVNQRGQGYTPSIAPSERSNVGMASRYRPVSTAVPPPNKGAGTRASTFTSVTMQGWNQQLQQPQLQQSQSSSTIKAVKSNADRAGSDDDDDEAWAEMKKKRDRKRSTWKMKKGQSAFQDIFHVGS